MKIAPRLLGGPITDTGQTGPDKGTRGRYLILAPDRPDMNPEGYFVFRSPTNNIWSGQRGLDADPAKAKAALEEMKTYRYRDNPPSDKTRGHDIENGRVTCSALTNCGRLCKRRA
jgi:hypothetical protein